MGKSNKCECTMSIPTLGDGCRYCQPQEYIDRLHESIEDDKTDLIDTLEKISLEGYCLGTSHRLWKILSALSRAIEELKA